MKEVPADAAAPWPGSRQDIASERALHMLAQGQPLPDVLAELALSLEAHDPGLRVATFLLRGSPPYLVFGSAPSLPSPYAAQFTARNAADSEDAAHAAASGVGNLARSIKALPEPLARAASHNCCTLALDIADDEAWHGHRHIVELCGVHAAWTVPINSYDGSVIGLLLVHHVLRGHPTAAVAHLIATTAKLAGVAILRYAVEIDREHLLADLKIERIERDALSLALQQAARSREEFMCIAAHELRTPLSALMLQADSAARLMKRDGMNPERLAHKVGSMQKQIDRLKHLVEDLLDVSAVMEGNLKLRIERIDLVKIIREAAGRCAEAYGRARCELRLHLPESAEGQWDGLRLSQVITNLLMNGLKYGMGAPVEVFLQADDAQVILRVEDHGIGIAPDQHARIFQRFGRAVSEKNYGGFGLGLWLSRQIVDALDGSITVESVVQQGATFVVRLPRVCTRQLH